MRTLILTLSLCLSSHTLAADFERLHLLIPGAAGGGWDLTARGVGEALSKSGLVDTVTFENMSGGGGAKAIAHLLEIARPDTLMVNSTPIVVRALQGVFPQTFRDLTPVASVIGDYSVIVVRQQSEVQSLRALAAAMRAEPRSVAIAGGSVTGGTDHIVAALVFEGFDIPAGQVKYIPYDAGGKAMAGLLSGEVQALSSGFGEVVELVKQGWVRILCTASYERLAVTPDTPTCIEAGARDATFVNWRGFFMAPGAVAPVDNDKDKDSLNKSSEAEQYAGLLQTMMQTEAWQTVKTRYGWVDLYRPGDEFQALLINQEQQLATLLKRLQRL